MPIEIEAKMKLDTAEEALAALKKSGAAFVGKREELNLFFDTHDERLVESDEGLRLRIKKDVKSKEVRAVLTHKGPAEKGKLKTREETEVFVSDPEEAEKLLNKLGFLRRAGFEKRRETWQIGKCLIEVDEVPWLGFFLEIEGPDEETIMKVREELGFGERPLIKKGYFSLLNNEARARGKSGAMIAFAAK